MATECLPGDRHPVTLFPDRLWKDPNGRPEHPSGTATRLPQNGVGEAGFLPSVLHRKAQTWLGAGRPATERMVEWLTWACTRGTWTTISERLVRLFSLELMHTPTEKPAPARNDLGSSVTSSHFYCFLKSSLTKLVISFP